MSETAFECWKVWLSYIVAPPNACYCSCKSGCCAASVDSRPLAAVVTAAEQGVTRYDGVAVGNNQGNNRSYVIVLQDPPTILRSRLPTGNVRDPVKDRERSLLPLPPRPGQAFNNPVYVILGDQWERQRMPLPAMPAGGSIQR
ncbi:hypothetical protein MTO96_051962 [Rhipicephalus appendiculatus]